MRVCGAVFRVLFAVVRVARGSKSTRTWNDPHIALARETERGSHLSLTFSVSPRVCARGVCARACATVLGPVGGGADMCDDKQ